MTQTVTPESGLSIGQLAAAGAVNVETVRFYQRRGLLGTPDKRYGSMRRYSTQDLVRLRFIKSAQRLGFSLDQVTDLLRLQDGTHCDDARRLAEAKLADVRDKLADLQRIESALGTLVARCADHGGSIACPLIESLQSG
ncbi:MAG: Hg(II)-responsive transcriptional regulator [Betaproteobacteria bacterium]|nr:Hg(II)-responsive transcriptional regulator [Betaproteobacteria bacterium]MDE2123500.1 Hg(II)-responsive transcriptional regulator [Betaproteobacteria bacterium]MDE2186078.1 Hg(II)-responsive transcriptional regulator [Betaproteobacteria bacterium]MDE2324219.1 Hg(II)-responsive transcriptional regulator [Betaproteobacteria bacterium]